MGCIGGRTDLQHSSGIGIVADSGGLYKYSALYFSTAAEGMWGA